MDDHQSSFFPFVFRSNDISRQKSVWEEAIRHSIHGDLWREVDVTRFRQSIKDLFARTENLRIETLDCRRECCVMKGVHLDD